MPRLPSAFEKKWPTILLSPIYVANHIITVPSTAGLHSRQKITLRKIGVEPKEFYINRVLSDTQITVYHKDGEFVSKDNPVEFDGGSLEMSEQNRNPIQADYVIRAVYEEEPAVALRTMLVSQYGERVSTYKDKQGQISLNVNALNGLLPSEYDEIILTNNSCGNPIDVKFYLNTTLIRHLSLLYGSKQDLLKVTRIV